MNLKQCPNQFEHKTDKIKGSKIKTSGNLKEDDGKRIRVLAAQSATNEVESMRSRKGCKFPPHVRQWERTRVWGGTRAGPWIECGFNKGLFV